MSDSVTRDAVLIERASEQLRQERETFDQIKLQQSRWFTLRLVMGFVAVVLLPAVMVVSGYVIFNPTQFPPWVLNAAASALFVDVLGILFAVWKVVLNPSSVTILEPVTTQNLDSDFELTPARREINPMVKPPDSGSSATPQEDGEESGENGEQP